LCFPEDHYMVDPLKRLDTVMNLIEQKLYFTLHAPRQTGKTTYLYAMARKLNAEEKYIALVVSFERAGIASMTLDTANSTVINAIYISSTEQLEEKYQAENPTGKNFPDLLNYLKAWCKTQEKPIVLFIDEIDALLDDVLISILRQLRDGYQGRPKYFPSSVALVGLRDVRDYKIQIREDRKSYGAASPFNIKAQSIFLKNFSKQEVFELLEQHTNETGQVFNTEVKEEIFSLSTGQPWLVNALANQIVSEILKNDYSRPITLDLVSEAKIQLIIRRDTHLDSLADKLREDRVKRIIQAIINGDNITVDIFDDDISYVRDLGLVSQSSPLEFANPIYAEIIPRIMASYIQESIPKEIQTQWFKNPDGTLNIKKLMAAFQEFYMENAESWLTNDPYKESVPHLILMAFLQRIVNAGGEIIREMAIGNGRIDLLVKYCNQKTAIELKIKRGEQSIEKAKVQLDRYLDRMGLKEGYLVVFDTDEKKTWEEKVYTREITYNDKRIIMIGV
jgi:hypothetical protein